MLGLDQSQDSDRTVENDKLVRIVDVMFELVVPLKIFEVQKNVGKDLLIKSFAKSIVQSVPLFDSVKMKPTTSLRSWLVRTKLSLW